MSGLFKEEHSSDLFDLDEYPVNLSALNPEQQQELNLFEEMSLSFKKLTFPSQQMEIEQQQEQIVDADEQFGLKQEVIPQEKNTTADVNTDKPVNPKRTQQLPREEFQRKMIQIAELSFKNSLLQNPGDSQVTLDDLKNQIEYYFCDNNLLHDPYMRTVIENNPHKWVDLKLFLKFNRVKNLLYDLVDFEEIAAVSKTKTKAKKGSVCSIQGLRKVKCIEVIKESLRSSSVLRLKNKKNDKPLQEQVQRIYPFNLKEAQNDANLRTVVVEGIPLNSFKGGIAKILEEYSILNIHIPVEKSTSQIKGYCLIEFDTIDTAEKVCLNQDALVCHKGFQSSNSNNNIIEGQGSNIIRTPKIIKHSKWTSEQAAKQTLIENSRNALKNEQMKSEKSYFGCLLKISGIQLNIKKTDVVQAARLLFANEFYCDYVNADTLLNDETSEINNKNNQNGIQAGEAMIRFKSEADMLKSRKRMIDVNRGNVIVIKGNQHLVQEVTSESELIQYSIFVENQRLEFRQFFLEKKKKSKNNKNPSIVQQTPMEEEGSKQLSSI